MLDACDDREDGGSGVALNMFLGNISRKQIHNGGS